MAPGHLLKRRKLPLVSKINSICWFHEAHSLFFRHEVLFSLHTTAAENNKGAGFSLSLSVLTQQKWGSRLSLSCSSQNKPLQTAVSCFHKGLEFLLLLQRWKQKWRMRDLKTSHEALFCLPVMFQKALSGVCPDVSGSQPHWLSWLCS